MTKKLNNKYHSKLTKCFNLIEEYFWDLQEVYDETKIIYDLNEKNCATLPYGLWKLYLIEECVKEIELENGNGIYTLSCDNFCELIKKYSIWKPKDYNEWNTDDDLLGISQKAKDCLSNIIYDLQNRKDTNVNFYRDLELPVE